MYPWSPIRASPDTFGLGIASSHVSVLSPGLRVGRHRAAFGITSHQVHPVRTLAHAHPTTHSQATGDSSGLRPVPFSLVKFTPPRRLDPRSTVRKQIRPLRKSDPHQATSRSSQSHPRQEKSGKAPQLAAADCARGILVAEPGSCSLQCSWRALAPGTELRRIVGSHIPWWRLVFLPTGRCTCTTCNGW